MLSHSFLTKLYTAHALILALLYSTCLAHIYHLRGIYMWNYFLSSFGARRFVGFYHFNVNAGCFLSLNH